MKLTPLLKQWRTIAFSVLLVAASITVFGAWSAGALRRDARDEERRQLHARIRDGVGREVQLAAPHDNPGQIRAAVNSAVNFISKRSGAQLSGHVRNRLAELEAATLSGQRRRLTTSELSNIFASVAVRRLARVTDAEILHMDDVLRGFNSPDLPPSFRHRDLKLRVGRVQTMSSEDFVAQVQAIRRQMGTPSGQIFEGAARRIVGEEVEKKARLFAEAVPEQLNISEQGFTPLQALLLAYSVASEDQLADSEENLNKRMKALQNGIGELIARSFPSPEGHTAFGVNGYLFSSPLDIAFDEATVGDLLDLIAERSAR